MPGVVADTHAVIWYLSRSLRLTSAAAASMHKAVSDGYHIEVPSISLVEVTYLVEKGRLPALVLNKLAEHLDQPGAGLRVAVDRLIHHSHVIVINGPSYRDWEHKQDAGTARTAAAPVTAPRNHRSGRRPLQHPVVLAAAGK